MRGLTRVVEIEGKDWTVRELTMAEIRAWLASLADAQHDALDVALVDGVHLSVVRLMTGMTEEQMAALLPSEIEQLVMAAKMANPGFFSMMGRLTGQSQKTSGGGSSAPSVLSSAPDTAMPGTTR